MDENYTPIVFGPEGRSVFARTILAAAVASGGISSLAQRLKLPRADLMAWMMGTEHPPATPFMACLEIVLDDCEALRKETGRDLLAAIDKQDPAQPPSERK